MYDKGWQEGKWKATGGTRSDDTGNQLDGCEGEPGNWSAQEHWWNQGPGQQQQPGWLQGTEVPSNIYWKKQGHQESGDHWECERGMAEWNSQEQYAQNASDYSNWTSLASAKGSPGMRQETNLNPFQGWTGAEAYQHNKGNESHNYIEDIPKRLLLKKLKGSL